MKTILNSNTEPGFNLALEEYVLKYLNVEEDIFLVWRNSKSVIIGRNQNPFQEINLNFAEEQEIPVLRRISGGGTVYHDLGNINFSFITKDIRGKLNNYKLFLMPIIEFLKTQGIESIFVEKSHIFVGNNKISGNAQSYYKNKMIHHGTLLYDVSLINLKKILDNKSSIKSKSIQSNIVNIINIKSLMKNDMSIGSFMDSLLIYILKDNITHSLYTLTKEDFEKIEKINESKYSTWKWNFGESPKFTVNYVTSNNLKVDITVNHGIIIKISTNNTNKLKLFNTLLLKTVFLDENISKLLNS